MPRISLKSRNLVFGASVVIVGIIIALGVFVPRVPVVPPGSSTTAPAPLFSPRMQEVVEKSKHFNYVVSYSTGRFSPNNLLIHKGETVRFFNMSSSSINLLGTNVDALHAEGGCDATGFDTCGPLVQNEFWELTFNDFTTWSYTDTVSHATGTITVH